MAYKLLKKIYKKGKMLIFSLVLRKNLFGHKIYCAGLPRISRKNKVVFGDNIYIGYNCHIGANVVFRNNVLVASNVSFVGGDHAFDCPGKLMIESGRQTLKEIVIEDDVWIGHGVIVMQGVTIGEGSIVAAGSIVTKSVTPYSIVGGNPCKEIRKRFSDSEIDTHKEKMRERNEAVNSVI